MQASAPTAPANRGRRVAVVALIVAIVVALGAIAAVLLATQGTTTRRVVRVVPAPTLPAAAPSVSSADVRTVLRRYASAYGDESVAQLDALFAPGFKRRNDGDPVQGRSAALATYAQQFKALTNPQYRLSDVRVTTGAQSATASGRYRITADGGTVTGRIKFALAKSGGSLVITRITTTPSTVRAAPSTPGNGGSEPTPTPNQTTPTPTTPTPPSDGGGGNGGAPLPWNAPELPPSYVPDLG